MQDLEFNEIVEQIRKEDARYDKRAYFFLRHGLDHTVKEIRKRENERIQKSGHVKGQELLLGLRDYALDQYGPMAKTVLNEWGITRCTHFGDIVYNLIEYNIFSRTESDNREDFSDIYSFDEVFVAPFKPSRPLPSTLSDQTDQ
jgi:uncharacterized repeat protein (TIGR04138 family)